jgi:hypothetical protein
MPTEPIKVRGWPLDARNPADLMMLPVVEDAPPSAPGMLSLSIRLDWLSVGGYPVADHEEGVYALEDTLRAGSVTLDD